MLPYVIVAIFVVMVLAMIVTALLQRGMFRKKMQLEISNQGNVPSQYLLRAEGLNDLLAVQFTLEGEPLAPDTPLELAAEPEPGAGRSAPERPGGVGQAADRATGVAGLIAELLSTLGAILPRSVAGPLLSAAGSLRSAQATSYRAQRVPGQIGSLKGKVSRGQTAAGQAPSGQAAGDGRARRRRRRGAGARPDPLAWLQTPPIFPGETLVVDLHLRAMGSSDVLRTFQVVSRPAGQEAAAAVVAQGQADISAGFWARLLPYLVILAAAVLSLLLVGILASLGLLGR